MEDFYNISLNTSYENDTNYDIDNYYYDHYQYITTVFIYFVVGIGLPLTLLSFCGVYFQVRNNEAAPIYIINLLVSNIIQFCCMIVMMVKPEDERIFIITHMIHSFALFTSLAFRVCVSMERYLIITWPLWYHFRRTTNVSAVICVMVWTFSLIFFLRSIFWQDFIIIPTLFILFLLPLPLFIFFLVGTCKALSTSSVPSDEKRQIVTVLVVVLLNNMLPFLPAVIWFPVEALEHFQGSFVNPVLIFILLSPLADLLLYVFSRKGAVDKLLSSLCCCIVDNINTSTEQQVE